MFLNELKVFVPVCLKIIYGFILVILCNCLFVSCLYADKASLEIFLMSPFNDEAHHWQIKYR